MCSQTETMYKSNITQQQLCILSFLITRPRNRGRGGAHIGMGVIILNFDC